MERIRRREHSNPLTAESFESESERLGGLIWSGDYKTALPLADKVLEYRSKNGERPQALVQYASNYYSAASRSWKDGGIKAAPEVGTRMNTALRALQERVELEMDKQGGKKEGMIPVSLDGMTSGELDVMQTVYRRAGEMADRMPLIKPLRQLLLAKESDPVRDFDAAALLAIRAGLKKLDKDMAGGKDVAPEAELFLRTGAFDIAQRYGWGDTAEARAEQVFDLARKYVWPPENDPAVSIGTYGQAARFARHTRDVARRVGDEAREREFNEKAKVYAAHVPDQKAKL